MLSKIFPFKKHTKKFPLLIIVIKIKWAAAKVGATMERYDLIREVPKHFGEVFQSLSDLRTALAASDAEEIVADFGGSVGSYGFRFKVFSDSVAFLLKDDSCVYYMHMYFNNATENVLVYSDPVNVQIEYGNVADRSIIRLIDLDEDGRRGVERSMQYPIQEGEYFQLLTVQELAEEEFYDELVNDVRDYLIAIQVNDRNGTVRTLGNIFSEPDTIKRITSNMQLLIGTYRGKNKV